MKKIILFISLLLISTQAFAEETCFIAKENNQIIQQEGNCKMRYAPESTFKIALALMGYDSAILEDTTHPEWPFEKDDEAYFNACKGAHTAKAWMRDSCIWYSQKLTRKLGMEKFKDYITRFGYGNQDISGDKGKNNGLTHSWLSSSLQISPEEQTMLLQKLLDEKLDISKKSYDMTKEIMFIQELSAGWKLYGKTGTGRKLDKNGKKTTLQHGWFVGWIEKNGRAITFAGHLTDSKKHSSIPSMRIRGEVFIKLANLIDKLEEV